jgi:NTE family protein
MGIVKRALVLAGGGIAGVAWELGVLCGIQDADPELAAEVTGADVIIGTSAGSIVAVQVSSGTPLPELYDQQQEPVPSNAPPAADISQFITRFAAAADGVGSAEELRRRIGAFALEVDSAGEPARRASIAARLPVHTWPDQLIQVTAVDAETGEPVVFTRDSGVDLVDAVTASTAVPAVWPTATIDGRRYMDGGMRSATNADLAAGYDRVLVLTPMPRDMPTMWNRLPAEIERLGAAEVHVVYGDAAAAAAFGTNPLSLATRGPAARAGRDLGAREAVHVAKLWH